MTLKTKQKRMLLAITSLLGASAFAAAAVKSDAEVSQEKVSITEKATILPAGWCEAGGEYCPLTINLVAAGLDLLLETQNHYRYEPKFKEPGAADYEIKKTNAKYNPALYQAYPITSLIPSALAYPSSFTPSNASLAPLTGILSLPSTAPLAMSSNASLAPSSSWPLLPFNISFDLSASIPLSLSTLPITASTSGFSNPSQPSSGPSNWLLAPLTASSLPLNSSLAAPLAASSSLFGSSSAALGTSSLTLSSSPAMPFSSSLSVLWPSFILPSFMLATSVLPSQSSLAAPSLFPYYLSILPLNSLLLSSTYLVSAPFSISSWPLSSIGPSSLSPLSSSFGIPSLTLAAPFLSSSSVPLAAPGYSLAVPLQASTNLLLNSSYLPISSLSSVPPFYSSMDPWKPSSSATHYSWSVPIYASSLPLQSSLAQSSLIPSQSLGSSLAASSLPLLYSVSSLPALSISPSSSIPPSSLSMDPWKSSTSLPAYSNSAASRALLAPASVSLTSPFVTSSLAPLGSSLSASASALTSPGWLPLFLSSSLPGALSALPSSIPAASGLAPLALGLSSQAAALSLAPFLIPSSQSLSFSLGAPLSTSGALSSALPALSSSLAPLVSSQSLAPLGFLSSYVAGISFPGSSSLGTSPGISVASVAPSALVSTQSLLDSAIGLPIFSGSLAASNSGLALDSGLLASSSILNALSSGSGTLLSSVPTSFLLLSSFPFGLSYSSFIAGPLGTLGASSAIFNLTIGLPLAGLNLLNTSTSASIMTLADSFLFFGPSLASYIFWFESSWAGLGIAVPYFYSAVSGTVGKSAAWSVSLPLAIGGGFSITLGALSTSISLPFYSGGAPVSSSALPLLTPFISSTLLGPFISSSGLAQHSLFASLTLDSLPTLLSLDMSSWVSLPFPFSSIGFPWSAESSNATIALVLVGQIPSGLSFAYGLFWMPVYSFYAFELSQYDLAVYGLTASSLGSYLLLPVSSSWYAASRFGSSIGSLIGSNSSSIPLEFVSVPLASSNSSSSTSSSLSSLAPLMGLATSSAVPLWASTFINSVGQSSSSAGSLSSSGAGSLGILSAIIAPSLTTSLSIAAQSTFGSALISSLMPVIPLSLSAQTSANSIFGLASIPAASSLSFNPLSAWPFFSSIGGFQYALSGSSSAGAGSASLGSTSAAVSSSLLLSLIPSETVSTTSLASSSLNLGLIPVAASQGLSSVSSAVSSVVTLPLGSLATLTGILGITNASLGVSLFFGGSSSSITPDGISSIPIFSSGLPSGSISSSGAFLQSLPVSGALWLTSGGFLVGDALLALSTVTWFELAMTSLYGAPYWSFTFFPVRVLMSTWPSWLPSFGFFPLAGSSAFHAYMHLSTASQYSSFASSSVPSSLNPSFNGLPLAYLLENAIGLSSLGSSISGTPLWLSSLPFNSVFGSFLTTFASIAGIFGIVSYIGVPVMSSVAPWYGISSGSADTVSVAFVLSIINSGISLSGLSSFIPGFLVNLWASLVLDSSAMPLISFGSAFFSGVAGVMSIPAWVLSGPASSVGGSLSLYSTGIWSLTSSFGVPSSFVGSSVVGSSVAEGAYSGLASSFYGLSLSSNAFALSSLPSSSVFPLSGATLFSTTALLGSSVLNGVLGTASLSSGGLDSLWSSSVLPSVVLPLTLGALTLGTSSLTQSLSSNPLATSSSLPSTSLLIGPIGSGIPGYSLGTALTSSGLSLSSPLSLNPSLSWSFNPSLNPLSAPFSNPSLAPFSNPSLAPFSNPLLSWISNPSVSPLVTFPSSLSTNPSSTNPISNPSTASISNPSLNPSSAPFVNPALSWLSNPLSAPFSNPSSAPLSNPSSAPLFQPLTSLSTNPSSNNPSSNPSTASLSNPSLNPSSAPLVNPSLAPWSNPSSMPWSNPLSAPSSNPSVAPLFNPSSGAPWIWSLPASNPSTAWISNPSLNPSTAPSSNPSSAPFSNPSLAPSSNPLSAPFSNPFLAPISNPLSASFTNPLSQWPSSNPSASISNPSLNPSTAPLSNPLLSSWSNPSSVPLFNPLLSWFSNPSLAPISSPFNSSSNPLLWAVSGPLSSLGNPLSSSISNPLTLSSNPISSSLPSTSLNPMASLALSSAIPMAPSLAIAGPAMSSRVSGIGAKPANRPGYYIPGYDFTKQSGEFEFRNVVTFGDSLSDTGSAGRGGVYMATGNPFFFYNSLMSIYLTGKFNAPRTQNGTNYAVSGALVRWATSIWQILGDPLAIARSKMSQQINAYYADNNGAAHPNDVFILWGGGNDMTGDLMRAVLPNNWSKLFTADDATGGHYIDTKPITLGNYARGLTDKGAENVFVLGLPDPGLAPFSGAALVGATLGSMGILTNGTLLEKLDPGNWALTAMDRYLRNNDHLIGSPEGRADEYFIENYAAMYHHFVPFIPMEIWRQVATIPGTLQRNLVQRWNRDLMNTVQGITGGNVIYGDIYRLYEEIQNNPFAYGFTNTLVAQCTLGQESTKCDAGDDIYHGDDGQVYMYTDWHHPSPQMNQIIAEYLLSIFNAPGYIAGLSRVSEMNENARQNFMKNELKYLRFDDRAVGEWSAFADLIVGLDKNSRSLNPRNVSTQGVGMGFSYRVDEGWDLGASLALTYGDKKPSNQVKYKDSTETLALFTQYKHPDGFWANGQVFNGWEQMDDVKRSMMLYKAVRTEKGKTTGTVRGISAAIGYDIPFGELCSGTSLFVSPYLEANVTRFKVKGYAEEGSSSTAMEFAEQKRTNKLVTLGAQFSTRSAKLNANLDIAYTRHIDFDEFEGAGRLKNFAKSYHRSARGVAKERKGWFSLTPSVEYQVSPKWSLYGNLNYNYGNTKFSQLNGTIGIRNRSL